MRQYRMLKAGKDVLKPKDQRKHKLTDTWVEIPLAGVTIPDGTHYNYRREIPFKYSRCPIKSICACYEMNLKCGNKDCKKVWKKLERFFK